MFAPFSAPAPTPTEGQPFDAPDADAPEPVPMIFDWDTKKDAILAISHRHEAILNWLLLNPHRSLRECADELGFTQAWLSSVIHSDIFQAKLKERQESVFLAVAQDIPRKLRGLADVAIEKVTRIIESSEDPDLVVDVFDKTLNRLGYAPQKGGGPGPTTQVNMFAVSREDLASARAALAGPQAIEGQTLGQARAGAIEGQSVAQTGSAQTGANALEASYAPLFRQSAALAPV